MRLETDGDNPFNSDNYENPSCFSRKHGYSSIINVVRNMRIILLMISSMKKIHLILDIMKKLIL